MYCKNCGKKLPNDARFCDRCNTSVRKKEGKMDVIEELKEERLARRKAKAIEERLKSIKKVKRRRYKALVVFIIVVVCVGGASAIVSFVVNDSKDSPFTQEPEYAATPTPGKATEQTQTAASEMPVSDEYETVSIANGNVAYPKVFVKYSGNKKSLLALKTEDGECTIVVNKATTSLTAKELMGNYRDGIANSKAVYSLASASGYTISLTAENVTYHKKSYVKDGAEFYYEMSYPSDSGKAAEYEGYIEYMDSHFIYE